MASQHITDKNTLKSWFQRGMKPLASQFAAWMDSYWHKEEKIPSASVAGLEEALNAKAEMTELDGKVDILGGEAKDTVVHFSMAGERENIESGETSAILFGKVRRWFADLGSFAFASHLPDLIFKYEDRELVYDGTEEVKVEIQNEFNYLMIDLSLMDDLLGLNTEALRNDVRDQIKAFDDPGKPCIVRLLRDRILSVKESFVVLPTVIWDDYTYVFQLTNLVALGKLSNLRIVLTYHAEEGSVSFDSDKGDVPIPEEVFFLIEDGNWVINLNDIQACTAEGIYKQSWNMFGDAVGRRNHPAAFLKTPESALFQPVEYYFYEDGHGTMEIGYVKADRLVTEKMEFRNAPRNGRSYQYTKNEYVLGLAVNVIEIDLTDIEDLTEWYRNEGLLAAVEKQMLQIGDYTKPFRVMVKRSGTRYFGQVIMFNDASTDTVRGYDLTVCWSEELSILLKVEMIQIVVRSTPERNRISIRPFFAKKDDLIFLYEDGNGIINLGDELDAGVDAPGWDRLEDAFDSGFYPAVYLCTPASGSFCPVSYTYKKNAETSDLEVEMSLSYYKEGESGLELWIEKRVFSNGVGNGTSYNEGVWLPVITKYRLEA